MACHQTQGPSPAQLGLAIDRQRYQDQWLNRIKELGQTDPVVRKILSGGEVTENEWDELAQKLDAPEFWFEESSLRKAFDQPTGSLNDFIRAALGLYQFPTREQRVERAFTAWVAEHSNSINPDQARMLHLLRNVVLASVRETKYTAKELEETQYWLELFMEAGCVAPAKLNPALQEACELTAIVVSSINTAKRNRND